tara:strand:- start:125754 stop:126827 length:1074 start_codon:yes stop_codon:yes gene_type:complete
MSQGKKLLYTSAAVVVGLYFLFLGLIESRVFLAPLVIAIILALLMMPVARKMESWNINRPIAALLSTTALMLLSFGFFIVVSLQVNSFVNDWDTIVENMKPKLEQLENLVYENTPVDEEAIKEYREENSLTSMASGGGEKALGFVGSIFGFITDYLLVFIYIFFLINYRGKFRIFILKLFSEENQQEVKDVIRQTTKVGQQYLLGKLILILCLSVLYSIGLGISGVNNFILVSIIAAFLTLIPFLGNLIGMFLAVAFGFIISGDISVLIGILITFTVVQFLESYIFEPYIVGDKVDVQPFFVILAIILGNMLWGVVGMVIAVPTLGILNILFNHVEPLKPLGYLFSNEKKKSKKTKS